MTAPRPPPVDMHCHAAFLSSVQMTKLRSYSFDTRDRRVRTSKFNDPRGHSTSPLSQAPLPSLQQNQERNWLRPGQEYLLRGSNLGSTWCRISGTAPAQASDHTCFYPGVYRVLVYDSPARYKMGQGRKYNTGGASTVCAVSILVS